jgi:hypothetical protein
MPVLSRFSHFFNRVFGCFSAMRVQKQHKKLVWKGFYKKTDETTSTQKKTAKRQTPGFSVLAGRYKTLSLFFLSGLFSCFLAAAA